MLKETPFWYYTEAVHPPLLTTCFPIDAISCVFQAVYTPKSINLFCSVHAFIATFSGICGSHSNDCEGFCLMV